MKTLTLSVAFLFFFFCEKSFSQGNVVDTEYTFRIKIAASKTPISKTSKLFKDFAEAEGMDFPDGYIRYFVGKFETYHQAKDRLEDVKAKGYSDAYVICIHDGKILTVDQAIDAIYGDE